MTLVHINSYLSNGLPQLVGELVDGELLRHCQRLGRRLHNVVVAVSNGHVLLCKTGF